MSRRIDIELTSALADNSWTWRAAGAKQPKGVLDGTILTDGSSVGDVIKVEVEQEIDGITVLSVVGGRPKEDRADLLELLPSEREFKPVIETKAKRDRNDRGGRDGDRRPRRDRDDRGGRGRDGGRGREDRGGRDDRGGRGRDGGDSQGRGRDGNRGRRGPSFTPPPEIPQRPKPKRLKAGKGNRNAVLAELPEELRGIAELALQGMGAVRSRLKEANQKAVAEGRAPMPEASVLKMAEDILPKMRVAEWLDRAEAAQRQMEHLDLRDLRSVVAAAGDPMIARDDATSALATELTRSLATKQEQELLLWFGDVDAALAVGRVIRALRLSSQPPKAGVPFPTDIAQRLVDSTNAALAPNDSPERWSATLEAAAFSPIRAQVLPARKPDTVNDDLLATVKRLGPALPQVAALFEIEVDAKSSMPKPLRPGPRNKKGGKDDRGKRPERDKQSDGSNRSKDAQRKRPSDRPAAVIPPPPSLADTPVAEAATSAPTADSSAPEAAAPPEAAVDAPATGADAPETEATAPSDQAAESAAPDAVPATDASATEVDAPQTDEPATNTPSTEVDAPPTDEPATPVVASDEPVADAPAAEVDAPPTDEPATPAVASEPATTDDSSTAAVEPAASAADSADNSTST